jgi:hypothetical protein
MRKPFEEIQKIANKLDCSEIYSWSKYNTYKNDNYEYYLKYILKIPEDRNDSIYAPMGTTAHETLEDYYDDKIDNDGMLEKFEEKLFEYTVGELKYDRTDEDKNKKISNKYEACLRHFFKNHQKIPYKMKKEMFIPIKLDNVLIQGYIDFLHTELRNNIKHIVITDWKTSSIYKGEKLEKEKGQLILYGYGIHQKLNIPLDQIIVRWCFLKYVEIECMQANNKIKNRIIERNDIGNSLSSSVKMWLKKSDLKLNEEEIDNYLIQLISNNSIDCLPEDVKNKFTIKDCYVEVKLNKEDINELKEDIINTVAEIKNKEKQYKETKDNKIWWQNVTDKDSYRLANLCGYSAKIHKPYKEYLDSLEMFKDKKEKSEEDDLSWLEGLID